MIYQFSNLPDWYTTSRLQDTSESKDSTTSTISDDGSSDPVNRPRHYQTDTGIEAIDVIEAFFPNDFHLSNVFKYIARAGKKHDEIEDLRKARWYLDRAIQIKGDLN